MDVTGTHDGLIKLGSPASHAGNRGSIPRGVTNSQVLSLTLFPSCGHFVGAPEDGTLACTSYIFAILLARFSKY